MPSKTAAQRHFMRMCASKEGRKNARGECPPESVAEEFVRADKKKKKKKKRAGSK